MNCSLDNTFPRVQESIKLTKKLAGSQSRSSQERRKLSRPTKQLPLRPRPGLQANLGFWRSARTWWPAAARWPPARGRGSGQIAPSSWRRRGHAAVGRHFRTSKRGGGLQTGSPHCFLVVFLFGFKTYRKRVPSKKIPLNL